MDRIRIRGGNKLGGTIDISGAKNAALPLMIIPLLTPDTVTLHNVPRLVDAQRLSGFCKIMVLILPRRANAPANMVRLARH